MSALPHLRRAPPFGTLLAVTLAATVVGATLPEAALARAPTDAPVESPFRVQTPNPIVQRIQKALTNIGLYAGPVDGRMNRETEAAIKAYQRMTGLPVDGRATEALAQHLDTGEKVGDLLSRLEKARRENIDAARQALLAHPSTRDLITGEAKEAADPTRDVTPCFRNPTARCLLAEAAESSKAIAQADLRDWALGEVLAAQAMAGLAKEALDTVRRIRDPRLIMVALRDIAEAQALGGRGGEALAAADIIPDSLKHVEALAAIAEIQVRRGDRADARTTIARLLEALGTISDPLKRVAFRARAAVTLAAAGDEAGALANVKAAETLARAETEPQNMGAALRHVASALADMRQTAQAMALLKDLRDDSDRMPVLISAATQQAQAGDAAAAMATADSIEEIRYRAIVLGRVAVAQARAGDRTAADATIETALAAAERIKMPFARAYAASRLALALTEIGGSARDGGTTRVLFERAVATAEGIEDSRLKAQTLWTIAAARRRVGDAMGATATEARAEAATADVKSTLTQVWMFSEIAANHAQMGESEAGWVAFNRGLKIAEGITNAWGRSRALARLAQTLIQLIEPGTALRPHR
jgi:soluble cytochrome b562